jgi:hypothetical protein
VSETDAQFVDRMVSGLVADLDDEERYLALTMEERYAVLVWVAIGRVTVDGWDGWVESWGPRTDDLIRALRSMGGAELAELAELAEVVQQVRALFPSIDAGDAEQRLFVPSAPGSDPSAQLAALERRWFELVRTTGLIERHLAPWIRRHPMEMPSTVDDL